ncbi:hypothetical protein ANCCAN_02309 [Ancylostoma caninum]|uniref:SWIM-type domain-containing protein n=1 Tax=Ancylostoma caninum TaxID=29170 RepID=A0A368H4V1_ANCCA|nr:hypothetical protein ANCCAN_02309 [Ancylostoma caninum]
MHGVSDSRAATYYAVTCPACHKVFRTGEELAMHCNEMHREPGGQDFTMIHGSFPTQEEFEVWIDSVERLTKVYFTKRTSRICKNGRNHIFVCKHARGKGADVDPMEVKQRFKKSDRVHSHCPAFIRVTENLDGSVSYRGCLGHLGHKVGIGKQVRTARQKFRRWQTHRRHKDALLYYTPRVDSTITELSDDTWAVLSEDCYEYTVTVKDPCDCGENNIHCDRCGACPHQIRCNCTDVAHQGVACIHAHAVATFMEKARQRIPSVKHYLATDMPGCSSTPGPASDHEEDAPSPLDDYNSEIEEQYGEDYSRDEQQADELPSAIPPPPPISKKPLPSILAQRSRPKVTVEPLRRAPVRTEPLRPPSPVITLREEAKEELQQFQGLDEKLHMMLQTCMQSNLPHVIRDIRATIESKMSEILLVDGEKAPKTRLQKPLRPVRQNEDEPDSPGNQNQLGMSPEERPSPSHENKIPPTRKVLRREFLEAHSSRISLNDETRRQISGLRTQQRDQNQQTQTITPQQTRKVLKREFIEASSSRCRLLADKLQQQRQRNEIDIQKRPDPSSANAPNATPTKILRREFVEATPSLGVMSEKQAQLSHLPPEYRRVVRQIVTTPDGRRIVKRIVEMSGAVSSEQSAANEQRKVGKSIEDGMSKDVVSAEMISERNDEAEGAVDTPDATPGNAEIPVVTIDDSETPCSTEEQPLAASSLPFSEKVERPKTLENSPIKEPGQNIATAEPDEAKKVQSGTATPDCQRTVSETSKDGARVVKKIYARRGSEWVLKRVVIRAADERDIASKRQAEGREGDATQKAIGAGDKDPARNTPRRVIRRMVIRKAPTVTSSSEKSQEIVKIPSPADVNNDILVQRTSPLIQKSLCSALTPKSALVWTPVETVCLMCGKAEPPEQSDDEPIFWLGCSNAKKCHARAHEKCLRAARARCFVCYAGTWVRVLAKDSIQRRMTAKLAKGVVRPKVTFSAEPISDTEAVTDEEHRNKDGKATDKMKTIALSVEKLTEERSPALCEVNS